MGPHTAQYFAVDKIKFTLLSVRVIQKIIFKSSVKNHKQQFVLF
jgi:hypothetical protein